jgi:hypothetical protein
MREYRKLLALRACWVILRGGSVAWKLNFPLEGGCESTGTDLFVADCQIDGGPLGLQHLSHMDPEPQSD